MDLTGALDRLFPFARKLEVTLPLEADGSFLVELVLPVKDGQTELQVCRFPEDADLSEWEDRLRWRGPYQRASFGEGPWAFLAAWDGVASIAEIQALVISRVVRDPQLGHPAPT